MVCLREAPVRRTRGSSYLSVALYPPCCHLQSPTDCARRERRHVQLQGLSWGGPTWLPAASSSTSCRRASIAFVTTDFWPSLPARKNLRERVSCSPYQNRKKSPAIPAALTRQKPVHILVHAAVAACASSRPSRPAASRTTGHRRQPSSS